MSVRRRVRLETALLCAGTFLVLALLGNPFVPDVCASMGYGYPLPIYISWCECFFEKYPSSININYLTFDAVAWIGLWWVVSSGRITGRKCGKSRSIES